MKDRLLIEKWLTKTPDYAAVDVVKGLLVRAFGRDAICKRTGDSHQFRVKDRRLRDLPGFGPLGHLSVPVEGGQRVGRYYLRRIAQAIKWLEEVADESK